MFREFSTGSGPSPDPSFGSFPRIRWCFLRYCLLKPMNVLLLSMPDSFEHTPALTMRMPNGALASLAGNVDPHHDVAIADLILAQRAVPGDGHPARRDARAGRRRPVGHDVPAARRAFKVIAARARAPAAGDGGRRRLRSEPRARGLRDPAVRRGLHRARRGRHHVPRAGARARERDGDVSSAIAGLSYRQRRRVRPQPRAAGERISTSDVRPPNRAARVLAGYTMLGRPVDIVETSRGCTYDCSFCSIIEMRGRNFHTWPIDRVIADIADARGARRARDLPRGRQHHAERRAVQGAVRGDHRRRPERHRLHRAGDDVGDRRQRRRAGRGDAARRVPLRLSRHRERARSGPRVPARPRRRTRSARAAAPSAAPRCARSSVLHRHGMYVVGGLIVGNPGDTRESIEANLDVRAQVRGLAVHPASDAVPGHADDARLPRARA